MGLELLEQAVGNTGKYYLRATEEDIGCQLYLSVPSQSVMETRIFEEWISAGNFRKIPNLCGGIFNYVC